MKNSALAYFMWAYQPHFRFSMELRAKAVFSQLGVTLPFKALLVGVRVPEVNDDHPVCIEPEDSEWDIETFANVHARAGEIASNHPDQNMIYGDAPRMRDKPENIRRKSAREAVEEALAPIDEKNATRACCGVPVRVGNYHVVPVLIVPRQSIDALPHLTAPIKFGDWTSSIGIADTLIDCVLGEVSEALGTKEPGRYFDVFQNDITGLLRQAGQSLCSAVTLHTQDVMLQGIFEAMNEVSSLRYEGSESSGTIVFARPTSTSTSLAYQVKFLRQIPLQAHRLVRKVLEMSGDDLECACESSSGLTGLATVTHNSEEPVFRAIFTGHYRWELHFNRTRLMTCAFGVPSLPAPRLTASAFDSNVRRVLPGLTQIQGQNLWAAVSAAMDQRHGTMLVVSDSAAPEALRLQSQSIPVEPIPLTSTLMEKISGIDGAVLVDRDCRCHALGVILDGQATDAGDPARGARYNSALRYVSSAKVPTICLVVSEDGYVNMIPTLRPQVDRAEVARYVDKLASLTADDYHQTRNWLDDHRFYLTLEQCEVVNSQLERIDATRREVGEIRIVSSPFAPHPEMNDSYYIEPDNSEAG